MRLVTDSTADLPAELVERHGIIVVPAVLNLGGRSYRDGIEISRAEFYERLPALRTPPTTAAPAVGEFEAAYAQCGEAEIVSIHIAGQLSGVYNAARLGAEALGKRVTVIDSGQTSMGLGWQVLAAAEAIAAGKPLPEVLAAVESARRRVKVYALLDTIEYLRRGGRASALSAAMSELLQIKLMIELSEGVVSQVTRLRTRHKAVEKLVELTEALGPLERLAVLHAHCPDDAHALAARLASFGYAQDRPRAAQPPLVVEATSIIGTHVGPKALGIAAVKAI